MCAFISLYNVASVFKAIRHPKLAILHPKIANLHTIMENRAQGSTMMGPGLKVALWHWLIRGKGWMLAKIRKNEL